MEHSLYSNLAGLGTDQPGQQGGDGQVGPFVGGYNYENDAGFDHQQQTLDSTAGEEINKTPDVGHRIVLQDVEAYYDSLADSRKEQFERAAAENHVSDAPTNPAEQRVYIKRLFDAFVNTANVIDKPCKNGNVAQSVRRFLENYYPELAIEKACWEIFLAAGNAQMGVFMVEEHHNGRMEDGHQSFSDRMDSIIGGLTISKAMCKQVLDPSYINRLCDAPDAELHMKVNNKVINGQRDVQNELGRKVMKKKITTEEIDNLPDKPEEDGDGDEYNEEEDVPTQATSSTPIRTPVHRRDAAGSRAASSAYKTGPTSSAKRKKPLRSSAGNDGDDDDDGDYHPTALVTPTHRPVTRRRTAIVPSPTLRASSNDDDDENSGASNAGSLPSRRQPARRASNTSCRPSAGRRSAGRRSTNSSNPDPSTAVSELDLKKILCEILKVPADLATQYSLSDLRIYARAYNQAFVQQPWFQDDAPGFTGVGYAMHSEHGPTYHFAQVLHQLRDLAIARQDLNSDGTCNDDAPYMSGFYTNGDALQDQALGVAFNGFGLHPQYQTMSLQVQQSSPYSQMQQFSPYSSGPQFSPSSQGPQFSQDPQIAQLSTYSQNPQFSQEPQISQFSLYFEGP